MSNLILVSHNIIDKKLFGIKITDLLNAPDTNGVLQKNNNTFEFDGTGIKKIFSHALNGIFINSNILSASFPDLEEISGDYGMYACFYDSKLSKITMHNLKKISGTNTLQETFEETDISVLDLRNLQEVREMQACRYLARWARKLKKINLNALETVAGDYALSGALSYTAIEKIYFPSLKNISGYSIFGTNGGLWPDIFGGMTNMTEIHFRMDMQEFIETYSGYSRKWGATNATIYFDLVGSITVNDIVYTRSEQNSIYDDEGNQLFIAWENNNNYIYTTYVENSEPTVGTNVYSDEHLNIVGTISTIG
jgi:hypothetical protein